jgi:hypothetical protein
MSPSSPHQGVDWFCMCVCLCLYSTFARLRIFNMLQVVSDLGGHFGGNLHLGKKTGFRGGLDLLKNRRAFTCINICNFDSSDPKSVALREQRLNAS